MGYSFDADAGYIAYADSTENAANNNGVIYIGAVFPGYRQKERFAPSVLRKGTEGTWGMLWAMCLAVNDYEPGASIFYYWGIRLEQIWFRKPIPIGINIWKNMPGRYVIHWQLP